MQCLGKIACCGASKKVTYQEEPFVKQDSHSYESVTTSDGIIIEGTEKAGLKEVKLAYSQSYGSWALLTERPYETLVIPLTPTGSRSSDTMTYQVSIHTEDQKDRLISVEIPYEIHEQAMKDKSNL